MVCQFMKRLTIFLLVAGLGCGTGAVLVGRQQAARYARALESQRAAWGAEKAELEVALEQARARRTSVSALPRQAEQVPAPVVFNPEELLQKLAALRIAPGAGQGRPLRPVVALLDQLAQGGSSALPAIRQFLASGQDVAYDAPGGKGSRDVKALAGALAPASLRFGLFDVLRQIGGPDAEAILTEAMDATGRGLELAYLTEILEQMAPGKYKDAALAAAQGLLARAGLPSADRDYLFGILRRFNDPSYVVTAQAQLVQADGRVDRGALRYLQQSMGEQSIPLAAQLYKDPRITEADSREPLARVALAYVGANPQAAEVFHTAVLDQTLKPDHRRELVEDLNQDGLANEKNPTPADLQLIANRYALTQTYLQQDYVQNDKMLNAAFREADKDLRNMLQRAAAAAAAPAPAP